MKTFKDLTIKASVEKLISLVEKLKSIDFVDFKYASEKSQNYAKMIGKKSNEVLTFESPEIKGAVAFVWMVIGQDNDLKITNITPNKSGQLSIEQYNSILDSFYDRVIKPNIDKNYQVILSTDTKTIVDYAGHEVAEKLKVWIKSVNKSTLNTHPLDFERWASFLISAHENDSELTTTQLEKYLIDEIGIPDDNLVSKIVIDYEYGRDLLKEYDKHR
jgi:hypothetical protein